MARPKKQIDEKLVENLAAIGCTMTEIAALCNCSVDTLERRFAEVIEKGKQNMRMSIRRMQYESAEKGNVVMQIWLGKQYLNQSDRNDLTSGGRTIKEVRWSFEDSGDGSPAQKSESIR